MIFKLVLKGFKLKKVGSWAKKMAQPVQPVEDRLREAKKFLYLLVTFSSQSRLNLNRLRSNRGPVEAQRSLVKH